MQQQGPDAQEKKMLEEGYFFQDGQHEATTWGHNLGASPSRGALRASPPPGSIRSDAHWPSHHEAGGTGSLSALSIGYRTYKCAQSCLKPSLCRIPLRMFFPLLVSKYLCPSRVFYLKKRKRAEGGGERRIFQAMEGGRERGRRWEAEITSGGTISSCWAGRRTGDGG